MLCMQTDTKMDKVGMLFFEVIRKGRVGFGLVT